MAKRYLILIAIILITSTANAALSSNLHNLHELGGGDSFTIEISSDEILGWSGLLVIEDYSRNSFGDLFLNNPVSMSNVFIPSIEPYSGVMGDGYSFSGSLAFGPGIMHTIDITRPEGGYGLCYVSLWDDSKGYDVPVDYAVVYGAGAPDPDWNGAYVDAGGPYSIEEGKTITLLGYHSYGVRSQWSINGNVIGEDLLQEISYDQLVNELGLGIGTHQLELKIDGWNEPEYDYTTIEIIPEPATIMLLAFGALGVFKRKEI